MIFEFVGLFLLIAGFIIGLGAVTVIDIHGALGTRSSYWTVATTRTHKITKPLIWLGIMLALIGGGIYYSNEPVTFVRVIQLLIAIILVINGVFLSFSVSPFLLEREKQNKDTQLLPQSWQTAIFVSFVVSFVGWWTEVGLFAATLVAK